jgi:hypothetical protein
MALNHSSLENYYQVVFSMVQHHKYSITEIENLLPFERDLYLEMLLNYLKEQNKESGN